jgi:hypothetical protein
VEAAAGGTKHTHYGWIMGIGLSSSAIETCTTIYGVVSAALSPPSNGWIAYTDGSKPAPIVEEIHMSSTPGRHPLQSEGWLQLRETDGRSRHSQKAIENTTDFGAGGVGEWHWCLLCGAFLRYYEDETAAKSGEDHVGEIYLPGVVLHHDEDGGLESAKTMRLQAVGSLFECVLYAQVGCGVWDGCYAVIFLTTGTKDMLWCCSYRTKAKQQDGSRLLSKCELVLFRHEPWFGTKYATRRSCCLCSLLLAVGAYHCASFSSSSACSRRRYCGESRPPLAT